MNEYIYDYNYGYTRDYNYDYEKATHYKKWVDTIPVDTIREKPDWVAQTRRKLLGIALKNKYLNEGVDMVSVEVLKSLLDLYEQLKDQHPAMAEGIKMAVQAGVADYLGEEKAEKAEWFAPEHKARPVIQVVKPGAVAREPLTEEEHDWAKAGEKIQAIKSIRARLGYGLKEAKDLYEVHYPLTR